MSEAGFLVLPSGRTLRRHINKIKQHDGALPP